MPKKLSIFLLSLIVAFGFMSGGYGYWQKTLTIDGRGITIKDEPKERDLHVRTTSNNSSDDEQKPSQTNIENTDINNSSETLSEEEFNTDNSKVEFSDQEDVTSESVSRENSNDGENISNAT